MKYYIGVDGGATKSLAAVSGPSGKIISRRKGPALNYHAVGEVRCGKNLKNLLRPFIKKYRLIERIVMGLAGLDTPEDLKVYKRITRNVLPKNIKVSLLNDAEIALESACPRRRACPDRGRPRILVISGTGSSVYGEFKKKKAKAIGWDFILGDEGSAYWLGLEALKSAARAWEGRGRETILKKLVLKKSGKKNISSLMPEIYKQWHERPREFKKYIASFAMLFQKAKNDPVAKGIIKEGADELAMGVEAVIKRLKVRKNDLICVGFIGSAFKNPGLLPSLAGKIKKAHPRTYFVYNVDSLQGAINLAIKHG